MGLRDHGRILVFAVLVTALWHSIGFPLIDREFQHGPDIDSGPIYSPEKETAPKLVGIPLFAMSRIVKAPIIGDILVSLLMKANKFSMVRQFGAKLAQDFVYPAYFPVPEHEDLQVRNLHQQLAEDVNSNALLRFKSAGVHSIENSESSGIAFRYWGIQDYHRMYTSGIVSPAEAIENVLEFIKSSDELNPPLRAVTAVNYEDVRRQAIESSKRWKSGNPRGLLDGIPVLVKEEIPVAGYNTTAGSIFLHLVHGVEKEDSLPISRLRASGAIIIGKTNQHEIGIGTTGDNMHYGTTRNPVNTNFYPGGSSSGSAAAVAAGIVPLAIGTDGGGSIRIPAALCGVVGLKATFARIPHQENECWSTAHAGPITSSIVDSAIAYSILSGEDSSIPISQGRPKAHLHGFESYKDLSDVKIGIFPAYVNDTDDPQITESFYELISALKRRGATVVNIEIPFLHILRRAHAITILSEMGSSLDRFWKDYQDLLAPDSIINLSISRKITALDLISALRARNYAMGMFRELFRKVDIIATPATAMTAPELTENALKFGMSHLAQTTALMRFVFHGNLVGNPSIVVPVGYDDKGLPISAQFIADHWNEHLIFKVGAAAEDLRATPLRKPQVFFSVLNSANDLAEAEL